MYDILENFGYDIKLGRLTKTNSGFKQKWVDSLIAIDMIAKAYQNHYDIAILVAGDDDFSDVVNAVKDAGKRVIGAYFSHNISENLVNSFDVTVQLDQEGSLDLKSLKRTR